MQVILLLALYVPSAFAIYTDAAGPRFPFLFQKERTTLYEFFDDLHAQRGFVSEDMFVKKVNEVTGHAFQNIWELQYYYQSHASVEIKSCEGWNQNGLPSGVYIMYTNRDGTEFGTWEREGNTPCSPGELIVYDNGQPIFSLYCGNVIIAPAPPIAPTPVAQEVTEVAIMPSPPPELPPVPLPPRKTCRSVVMTTERGGQGILIPTNPIAYGGIYANGGKTQTSFRKECSIE